jgi:hypothetical protein
MVLKHDDTKVGNPNIPRNGHKNIVAAQHGQIRDHKYRRNYKKYQNAFKTGNISIPLLFNIDSKAIEKEEAHADDLFKADEPGLQNDWAIETVCNCNVDDRGRPKNERNDLVQDHARLRLQEDTVALDTEFTLIVQKEVDQPKVAEFFRLLL